MKKAFFTLAVALLAATGAWAQTFTFDNLKYTVTDETTHTVELTRHRNQRRHNLQRDKHWRQSVQFMQRPHRSDHIRRRYKHWTTCV